MTDIEEAWTQDVEAAKTFGGLRYIEGVDGMGLCQKPGRIYTGGNSGYQAIGLAYHIGARRIGLLGYDMQKTATLDHWHGSHPGKMGDPHESSFPVWCERFNAIGHDLASIGVSVKNVTRQTALTAFPKQTLEQFTNE